MGNCCGGSSGLRQDLEHQLRAKLEEVSAIFPCTKYCCVLTHQGNLVSSLQQNTPPTQEKLAAIASLHRAAAAFASTLNQNENAVLHIAGDQHLFSCYEVAGHLLAFYSEIDGAKFSTMDISEQDDKVQQILTEVRSLLETLPPM